MSINLDFDREERQGFPEVIYGEGKSLQQLHEIVEQLSSKNLPILITRISEDKVHALKEDFKFGEFIHGEEGRTLTWYPKAYQQKSLKGCVNLVCAGSSDLPVLAETESTLSFHGVESTRICDVGVAGIHRLFKHEEQLRKADINIVIAGMEGALPSVVGGLVASPLIAVPTSVGYGASFSGLSALLGMVNSCANGLTVVNIDNGFGAAMAAIRILNLLEK